MSLPTSTNAHPPRDAVAIQQYLAQQQAPKVVPGIKSWFAGKERLVVVEDKDQNGKKETHVEFRKLNLFERCFAKLGFGNAAFKNVILACAANPRIISTINSKDKTTFKGIITHYNDTHSSSRSKIDMTNEKVKALFTEVGSSTSKTTPLGFVSTDVNGLVYAAIVPSIATVSDLKKELAKTVNLSPEQFDIIAAGKILKDDAKVDIIGVEARDRLNIKMRPSASTATQGAKTAANTTTKPTTTSAPAFITLSAPGRVTSSIHFRGKDVPLEYIKVLDQTKANEAFVFCGCHALKNAAVSLGIPQGRFTKEAFEDTRLYQAIKAPIQAKSGVEGDASIAPLSEFWKELSDPSFQNNGSETLAKAHQVAQVAGSSLTMLTYDANGVEAGIVGGGCEVALPHIANLVELSNTLQSEKPFHHTFVMGSDEHWVTLTLEKSPEGSLKWYGLDSWRNNTDRFPTHIQVLDSILTNPQQFAQKAYMNLAGDDLERKRNWFNNDGTVKDPQDENRLKSEENQIKYIRRISYAAEFFTRAGWTNQSHPNEFAAVRALATFYSNLDATKQDPRLQKVLQEVSA